MNTDESITFTLAVDDIGIKYKHGSSKIKHLQKILAKPISKWDVKFDLTGSHYSLNTISICVPLTKIITVSPNSSHTRCDFCIFFAKDVAGVIPLGDENED